VPGNNQRDADAKETGMLDAAAEALERSLPAAARHRPSAGAVAGTLTLAAWLVVGVLTLVKIVE